MPIPKNADSTPRLTAKEWVYNTLLEWITDGTLQPGEKLSDMEIAGYFSVSRTPVREALQLLADQRLVEVVPGRESRVAPIDLEQAKSNYLLMGSLNAVALDLCAGQIDDSFLARLKVLNEAITHALDAGAPEEARRQDRLFHQAFFDLAGNHFLSSFADTLYVHCLRLENLYFSQGQTLPSIGTHAEVITALEGGDLAAAREAVIRNWTDTVQHLPQ